MGTLVQDVKYGLRMLAKNPGFTVVAVLTLALGIGANTAIFTVVNAVLLRPLPYREPDRLMLLEERGENLRRVSVSYPNFLDWRAQNQVFDQMAAVQSADFNFTRGGQPEDIPGYNVSASFFTLLGTKPILGRDFTPQDDKAGAAPVAIISGGLWRRSLNSDPGVVGKLLALNGKTYTIVGVLPSDFKPYGPADVYVPIGLSARMERGAHDDTVVVARLKSGATIERARAEMETIALRLEKAFPITNSGYRVNITPLKEDIVGEVRPAILVLFAAVGFVLLIACANVANLLLARATAREKEMAIRAALGASRARTARQLLTESLLLALAGGMLALPLGSWGVTAVTALIPSDMLQAVAVNLDGWVMGFTAAVAMLTAVLFGFAPAARASRQDVSNSLKEGGRGSSDGGSTHRLRSVLASAELALTLLLMTASGLMIRTLHSLLNVDPGFEPHQVLAVQLGLRDAKYSKPEPVRAFENDLRRRVATVPGVNSFAIGTTLPLSGDHARNDIYVEGTTVPSFGHFPHPDFHSVSPGYFQTLRIPLLRGRDFDDRDNENAAGVALISETTARSFFGDGNALGKRFMLGRPVKDGPWFTVVGIVGDTKQYGLGADTRTEVYLPFAQHPSNELALIVRSPLDTAALTQSLRQEIQSIDKAQPLNNVTTLEQFVADSVRGRRITMQLLLAFAALAMLLAAVGIYGVMTYAVGRRTHEIGIRMALGAERSDVIAMVVKQGLKLALWGVGVGLVAALGVTRLMSGLLFGVRPADPITLAAVTTLLVAIAMLAAYIPARRATKVDPMVALRYE